MALNKITTFQRMMKMCNVSRGEHCMDCLCLCSVVLGFMRSVFNDLCLTKCGQCLTLYINSSLQLQPVAYSVCTIPPLSIAHCI